jgi:hypothetical protein
MKYLGFTVLVLTIMTLSQCKKEELDIAECIGTIPTYTADIKSILDVNCASSGCHNASSQKKGYNLSTYDGAVAGAAKSAFLGSIQHKSGYSKMPKSSSKLSASDINKLSCWVQNGTPN